MIVQSMLLAGFEAGVGIVTARAYEATWEQAAVFSTISGVVTIILDCLVYSYMQNTRQLLIATLVIQASAGLAGVLATHLICEKTIRLKQAAASSIFSFTAFALACNLCRQPIELEKLMAKH